MHKIYTYIAGARREYCEDALYADERCAFVIDGATGVSGEKVTDAETDAAWFARRTARICAPRCMKTGR